MKFKQRKTLKIYDLNWELIPRDLAGEALEIWKSKQKFWTRRLAWATRSTLHNQSKQYGFSRI